MAQEEEEESEDDLEDISQIHYVAPVANQWVSLGSEAEIEAEIIVDHRKPVRTAAAALYLCFSFICGVLGLIFMCIWDKARVGLFLNRGYFIWHTFWARLLRFVYGRFIWHTIGACPVS